MAFTSFGYILSAVCLVLFPSTVLGSEIIPITKAPYVVQVWKGGKYSCAGSFVASNLVITSAQCLGNSQPNEIEVVGGASTLSEAGYRRKVVKYLKLPRYTVGSPEWDIAVMKLESPMKGYNMAIIRINDIPVVAGQMMQISGYEPAKNPSGHLRSISAPILKRLECESYYSHMTLPNSNTCAANAGLKDGCFGDPGSPVVSNGKLCGIVTRTLNCGTSGNIGLIVGTKAVSTAIHTAMASLA
ncbi:seminase-like [Haematobia irritans]|uniref:Putative trypsin alpha-3-like protein n=1 Tax=Haematobia irritans TaxID=7368 RepID=A0A1L8EC50_HAEIR